LAVALGFLTTNTTAAACSASEFKVLSQSPGGILPELWAVIRFRKIRHLRMPGAVPTCCRKSSPRKQNVPPFRAALAGHFIGGPSPVNRKALQQ
jgi:hypothetical protein